MQRARRGACVCAAAWTSLQRAVLPRALATDAGGKYAPSPEAFKPPARDSYDVLVLGGGHNGLVAAAYLARAGLSVAVLERRGLLGGAAVTEELVPGFRFSRASYLAGLLRPQIISDLGLHDHGFRYLVRDPSSFTPTPQGGLLLGSDDAKNAASIARFSKADAEAFPRYEAFLSDVRAIVSPLLDGPPPEAGGGAREKLSALWRVRAATRAASASPETLAPLTELLTAPAAHILDRWFESDVLKATLATDAVIGALVSPRTPGSAYVLLHHVMGEAAGRPGVWAYVQGGKCLLPSVISLLAAPACLLPALTLTHATACYALRRHGRAFLRGCSVGARCWRDAADQCRRFRAAALGWRDASGGGCAAARRVDASRQDGAGGVHSVPSLHGAHACRQPAARVRQARGACRLLLRRFQSQPCAVAAAAVFLPAGHGRRCRAAACRHSAFRDAHGPSACPRYGYCGSPAGADASVITILPPQIHAAYAEAAAGIPSTRPVVELTIPSVLDKTLAPPGCHVASLFCQYAPYELAPGQGSWEDARVKNAFADRAIAVVEAQCPGFAASIVGRDVLSPLDLERIFGLHRGNIFHGSLAPHQLAYNRPAPGWSRHRTPVDGLYLGGAGAHPGGGVMGAPGRNAAAAVLFDRGITPWWDA